MTVREALLFDDGAIRLLDVRCRPNGARPGATEEAAVLEVVFPTAGAFVRHEQARETIIDPTRALTFRPGEPYRIGHPFGPDRCLLVQLDRDDAAIVDPALPPDGVPTSPRTDLRLRRLARGLASGTVDPLAAGEVLLEVVEGLRGAQASRHASRAAAASRVVDRVREILLDRPDARLTLPALGRLVGVSPFHLARLFRGVTGLSVHAYRTRLRIRSAIERIDAGERDLARLALDLGFADQSHLTNTMRRSVGWTPASLRRPVASHEVPQRSTILQA